MGIGTTAAVVGGGIASSIGGAAIDANAAGNAASTQSNAAVEAAQIQAQESQNALNFNEQQYTTNENNFAPFLASGTAADQQLAAQFGNGGQQWNETFQAPTEAQAAAQPGYQFGLNQGEQALQQSAAARGILNTGGTAKAVEEFGQNYADQDYQQVYNNMFGAYQQNYNQFQQGQANLYNRLTGQVAIGQGAAGQAASAGQSAANTAANIDLTSGAQQGQDIQNAAAANAAGQIGTANAISGGLSGASSSISNYALLSQLLNGSGYGNNGWTPGGIDWSGSPAGGG